MKIKIELTAEEFNALQQLIDAGVRASGMGSVRAAAHFLTLFEQAAQVAQAEELVAQNASAPKAAPANADADANLTLVKEDAELH